MLHSSRFLWRWLCVAAVFLLWERPAHAYLDPGTGSFLFQLIIGAIFSALFGIKMFWTNIKLFFSSRFSRKKNTPDDSDDAR